MKIKVAAWVLVLVDLAFITLLLCLWLFDSQEMIPSVRQEAQPAEQPMANTPTSQQEKDTSAPGATVHSEDADVDRELQAWKDWQDEAETEEHECETEWMVHIKRPTHEKLALLSTGEIEALAAKWTVSEFMEQLKTLDEKKSPEEWLKLWTALGWKLDHDTDAVAQAEDWLMARFGQDDPPAMHLVKTIGMSNLPAAWDALSQLFELAAFSSRNTGWAHAAIKALALNKMHKGGTMLEEAVAEWYWWKKNEKDYGMPQPPYYHDTVWHRLTAGGEPQSRIGFELPPEIAERVMKWVDVIRPDISKGDKFYEELFEDLLMALEAGQDDMFDLTDELRKVRRFHPGITSFLIERYRQDAATGQECASLYLYSLQQCRASSARDFFLEVLRDGGRKPVEHTLGAIQGLANWWQCQESEELLWNMLRNPPAPEVLTTVAGVLTDRFKYREALPDSHGQSLADCLTDPRFSEHAARLYKPHVDRIWELLVPHGIDNPQEVVAWIAQRGKWPLAFIAKGNIEQLPQTLFLKDVVANHSETGVREFAERVLEEFRKLALDVMEMRKGWEEYNALPK
jgi:hypothetical protein